MVLVESTENDSSWLCDFCDESNEDIEKEIGEKVKPWRCSEDFRVDASTNSCNYDVCSRCIEEYRVSKLLVLIFFFYPLQKKPLNFIKCTFSNSTEEKRWLSVFL